VNAEEIRSWAEERIRVCRRQELKFGRAWSHRERHHRGLPQTLVEAWTERRTLQALLEMIDTKTGGSL